MTKESKEAGFISHLTELRTRLISSLIFLLVLFRLHLTLLIVIHKLFQ